MGDERIGGEEGKVGVDARGHRVIVAGADMDVARELAGLAADDQRELGVRLQLDEAVDHLHARPLEVARPADVGLLVEARLELDERGDRLARFGRLGELPHDRRVVRGAVERLLDGDDVGILRRLAEELHHHVEGFVGVVDDEVLLPDGGEAVAAVLADALGEARRIGRKLQLRPVDGDELGEIVERQDAVDEEDLVRRDAEGLGDELAELLGHRRLDLEADHRAAAAALQRALEEADEILGLFLELDVRIADRPEGALPFHRIAGEEPCGEKRHRLVEADEAIDAALARRQADEAVEALRHAHQRGHALAARLAPELERNRQAEIGDERERVRGIDGERRQHREDGIEEMVLQPVALALGDLGRVDENDAVLAELAAKHAPAALLVARQHRYRLADLGELRGERLAVVAGHGDALALLALRARRRGP